jgi:hypothetical protein
MDVTTISNNVPGGGSQAMDYGVRCNASVSDGAQQWCISWKCWIPCCFYKEVVADCAVVVNSWLLYSGDWSPTKRWGWLTSKYGLNWCRRIYDASYKPTSL